MPGPVPGIHVLAAKKDVDGRDKPGHDWLMRAEMRSCRRGGHCFSACVSGRDSARIARPANAAITAIIRKNWLLAMPDQKLPR